MEDDNDDKPPWYRYPTWGKFVNMINKQFQDPAIKEVHKKCMYKLCMMGSATVYFQKLKEEAKLARRWGDESDRGAMV